MKHSSWSSIEPLESRIAPATFVVTSVADPAEAGKVTLRDALALADARPGPDTIVFKLPAPPPRGENTITLTGSGLESDGNVTIVGPGAGRLIVNGAGQYRVFHFDDGTATDQPVSISGLSIVNGRAATGAGISSTESLALKSVIVANNSATGSNGGIEVVGDGFTGKKFSMSNSQIVGNQAAVFSGGVALAGVLSVAISKTTVVGNLAGTGNGGGIAVVLGSTSTGLIIKDSVISGNFAAYGAGLVLVNNNPSSVSKMVISGTKITGNIASSTATGGGGIFLGAGHAVITGSTVANNSSPASGGGMQASGFSSLSIISSIFTGNAATASSGLGGGGIQLSGDAAGILDPLKIVSSVFTGNRSDAFGGGISATNGVELSISNSTVSSNRATGSGGGISATGTGAGKVNLTVAGGAISDNRSLSAGGGLAASADGAVSISATKVLRNVGGVNSGGILIEDTTAPVVIKNVVVSGNFSGTVGGGLVLDSLANFQVSGGSFTGNGAASSGGGIYIVDSTGSIRGAAITGNTALDGGGVYHPGAGTVTLQIAKVIANSGRSNPNVFGIFTFV